MEIDVRIETGARIITADSAYMRRIFGNLMSNTFQAMPRGGKLTIHMYEEKLNIIITVQDTGVEITQEVRSKVFTPLFTTKSKGQGFGLAVVKRLIEALGVTITFQSQEGKGTEYHHSPC